MFLVVWPRLVSTFPAICKTFSKFFVALQPHHIFFCKFASSCIRISTWIWFLLIFRIMWCGVGTNPNARQHPLLDLLRVRDRETTADTKANLITKLDDLFLNEQIYIYHESRSSRWPFHSLLRSTINLCSEPSRVIFVSSPEVLVSRARTHAWDRPKA